MNAPELLRAGGWRQGHDAESGVPYWEHAERYGLVRYGVEAALADELAQVRAQRDLLQPQLARALELLAEAHPALQQGAAELRKVIARACGAEPHWLVKDFNVLYRAALKLFDEAEGAFGGSAERTRRALGTQLERLKPAFAETEAARAELAEEARRG